MTSRMLVAGVGNIFLGDDGFGVEVARRLATEDLPEWVRVADYGISGMHLAYDLANGYETTILIDATSRGDEPGTIYVIELDHSQLPGATADSPPAASSSTRTACSPMSCSACWTCSVRRPAGYCSSAASRPASTTASA